MVGEDLGLECNNDSGPGFPDPQRDNLHGSPNVTGCSSAHFTKSKSSKQGRAQQLSDTASSQESSALWIGPPAVHAWLNSREDCLLHELPRKQLGPPC